MSNDVDFPGIASRLLLWGSVSITLIETTLEIGYDRKQIIGRKPEWLLMNPVLVHKNRI